MVEEASCSPLPSCTASRGGVGAHIFFLVLLTPGQPFLHSCSGPAPAHCKHHKTNYFGLETALLSVSRGLAK